MLLQRQISTPEISIGSPRKRLHQLLEVKHRSCLSFGRGGSFRLLSEVKTGLDSWWREVSELQVLKTGLNSDDGSTHSEECSQKYSKLFYHLLSNFIWLIRVYMLPRHNPPCSCNESPFSPGRGKSPTITASLHALLFKNVFAPLGLRLLSVTR